MNPPANSVGWTKAERVVIATAQTPLRLELGGVLEFAELEIERYGEPPRPDNVILICHGLTGDAHAAGWDAQAEVNGRPWRVGNPGWWEDLIGPGKAIDTRRFHVIVSNVLGSCYGSTGPASLHPDGQPWGMRFPLVTVGDWVRAQALLLDRLGIGRVRCVLGGSLGGQQAMEWALTQGERVERVAILAAAPTLSAQGLAFNAVGRHTIMTDAGWRGGTYHGTAGPEHGLAAARMLGHITYLSEDSMQAKFGRRAQYPQQREFGFGTHFQVESYLQHQGRSFVNRFDANCYLYLTRAMDFYDVATRHGKGDLLCAVGGVRARCLILSFSSDWLYPPKAARSFAEALISQGGSASYMELPSPYGHDAFLLEDQAVGKVLSPFLCGP